MRDLKNHRKYGNYDNTNIDNQNEQSNFPYRRNSNKNTILGILFLIVGGVLIANRMGLISEYLFHLVISWQALLIGIGIMQIVSNRHSFGGIVLIILGGIFILPKMIILPLAYGHLVFPTGLVVIGIVLIIRATLKPNNNFQSNFRQRFNEGKIDFSNDYIDEHYVFGGKNLNVTSRNFKGGRIEAIFGGGKINFMNAELSTESKNILEVDLIFGGLEIIVPRDWNVIIRINAVLGGFTEKDTIVGNIIDPTKELVIIGKTIFGGGEIKRF